LTAVREGIDGQEVYQPVIEWFPGSLDGKLEVIVSLVQLIPEEQVGLYTQPRISSSPDQIGTLGPQGGGTHLRELELGCVEFLHDLVPEYVGGGEKPAPSAPLLVSPGTGLEIDDVVEHMLVRDLGISVQ
jgi:hypothetical protein